jgi:hypothetical protein
MSEEHTRFSKKRREPRKELAIPTKIREINSSMYHKGYVRDISPSGARVDCEEVLTIDTLIEFIVDDPDHEEHFLATGKVKWVGEWTAHYDGELGKGLHKYGIEIVKKHPL